MLNSAVVKHDKLPNPTRLPETFHFEYCVSPMEFENMMVSDDMKRYVKEKMAYQLAMKILETNRATFTYINHHNDDMITVRSKVIL